MKHFQGKDTHCLIFTRANVNRFELLPCLLWSTQCKKNSFFLPCSERASFDHTFHNTANRLNYEMHSALSLPLSAYWTSCCSYCAHQNPAIGLIFRLILHRWPHCVDTEQRCRAWQADSDISSLRRHGPVPVMCCVKRD